jgi:WD40 repeat protein
MLRLLSTASMVAMVAIATAASPKHVVMKLDPVEGRPYPPVVTALAYCPQLNLLAAGGDDHGIRLVDATTQTVQKVLLGHQDWVRTLSFSNDANLLASAGNDAKVIFWNRLDDWTLRERVIEGPAVSCARFAPDSRTLATVGFRAQLDVLGIGSGQAILKCSSTDLRALAYSADGRFIAFAGRTGTLYFANATALELLAETRLHKGRVRQIEFIPNTTLLVSCAEDGTVVCYDYEAKKQINSVNIPGCKLYCLNAFADGLVAVGGTDNRIHIVDIHGGKVLVSWEGHTGSVAAMALCGQTLATASYDTTIRFWDLSNVSLSGERIADSLHPRTSNNVTTEGTSPR